MDKISSTFGRMKVKRWKRLKRVSPYCKNYDFVPLPSYYQFLASVTHSPSSWHSRPSSFSTVPHRSLPSSTVPHRPLPSSTVPHRPSPFSIVRHRPLPFPIVTSRTVIRDAERQRTLTRVHALTFQRLQ